MHSFNNFCKVMLVSVGLSLPAIAGAAEIAIIDYFPGIRNDVPQHKYNENSRFLHGKGGVWYDIDALPRDSGMELRDDGTVVRIADGEKFTRPSKSRTACLRAGNRGLSGRVRVPDFAEDNDSHDALKAPGFHGHYVADAVHASLPGADIRACEPSHHDNGFGKAPSANHCIKGAKIVVVPNGSISVAESNDRIVIASSGNEGWTRESDPFKADADIIALSLEDSENGRSKGLLAGYNSRPIDGVMAIATEGYVDTFDGQRKHGTSFAAPRLAVALSILMDANPGLGKKELLSRLYHEYSSKMEMSGNYRVLDWNKINALRPGYREKKPSVDIGDVDIEFIDKPSSRRGPR